MMNKADSFDIANEQGEIHANSAARLMNTLGQLFADAGRPLSNTWADDMNAIDRLIIKLEAALEDDSIKKSEAVSRVIAGCIDALAKMRVDTSEIEKNIAAAFSSSAQSMKARQPREKEYKNKAQSRFAEWSNNPALHTNKASFQRYLVEQKWCKETTAITWAKEFIAIAEKEFTLSDGLKEKLPKKS